MKKIFKNNKGFSLMELLVGLAISCIVLVAAYSFVLAGLKSYDTTKGTTEFQEETQFVENIIVDAVENGVMEDSDIVVDASDNVRFETGKQILYYDKAGKSLYIYDKGETIDMADTDDALTHLVSKNVEKFEVSYAMVEKETNADGTEKTTLAAGEKRELVEVEVEISKNGKSQTSKKLYRFRNVGNTP